MGIRIRTGLALGGKEMVVGVAHMVGTGHRVFFFGSEMEWEIWPIYLKKKKKKNKNRTNWDNRENIPIDVMETYA